MNIENLVKLLIKNIESSLKVKNMTYLYTLLIIIYITLGNKINFIKVKHYFFSNEITKLLILGISIYIFSINKLIGIFFIMAFLISLNISWFYSENNKNVETFINKEKNKWCKKKRFNINSIVIKDIIKLIDNIKQNNIELNDTSKKLIKGIINNIDKDIINCMPNKMKSNLKIIQKL